ncbi:MAG: hypothetical protein QOJ59_2886, partial [Thermomicrobiales bacterium]|nr:hypothetical protein [Thermomicrobiales bacterium]
FLGHDLLMAADAHHVAAAPLVTEETGHQVSVHHAAPVGHTGLPARLEAQPRNGMDASFTGCGFYRIAVPTRDDCALSGPQDTLADVVLDRHALSLASRGGAPPTTPAGVRRALLQVFLI